MVRVRVFILAICSLLVLPAAAQDGDHYWPQWRGPMGTGAAPHANPPVSGAETENIRWKIALPGSGHSTPIVWGDRVFITAAVPYGDPMEPRYDSAHGTHDSVPVTRHHRFMVARHQPPRGEDPLAADAAYGGPARRGSLHRNVRIPLARHRRRACLCVLRLARALWSRPGRRAAVESRPR